MSQLAFRTQARQFGKLTETELGPENRLSA